MHHETIEYFCNGQKLIGYLVYDELITFKRPAIIVAHAWKGQDQFARKKAEALAKLGYVGFAADVYGEGINVQSDEEALALMLPLFLDRRLLRERINAALTAVQNHPKVESTLIGAIGFCFGGLTVIELLRSGADVAGVVSFHGVLGNELSGEKANLAPNADKIMGSLLILHGNEDPLVSQEDIHSIQREFTRANVDWQMITYGHCMHAFTNPEAHDEKNGLVYNSLACARSWLSMENFFEELFT